MKLLLKWEQKAFEIVCYFFKQKDFYRPSDILINLVNRKFIEELLGGTPEIFE